MPTKIKRPKTSVIRLPFVIQIVEGHGGAIRVESDKGKGSEFILTFPEA